MKNTMDMNKQELDELIRKYENGDTSLGEEQKLLHYFTAPGSDPRYADIQSQFLYFRARKEETPGTPITLTSIIDERHRPPQWLILRIAAVVVLMLGVAWWAFLYDPACTVTAGPDNQTSVVLPDGTTVFLNNNSELVYKRGFGKDNRTVHLDGEAYFDVKRDTASPFIVYAGDIAVEVVGTAFNLRSYKSEDLDALDVREGRVLFGATEKIVVERGRGARYYKKDRRLVATSINVNADAWKSRTLSFMDVEMGDVIRELERFYHVTIRVSTPSFLHCRLTAEFDNADITRVLDAISYSLHTNYSREGNVYLFSASKCR